MSSVKYPTQYSVAVAGCCRSDTILCPKDGVRCYAVVPGEPAPPILRNWSRDPDAMASKVGGYIRGRVELLWAQRWMPSSVKRVEWISFSSDLRQGGLAHRGKGTSGNPGRGYEASSRHAAGVKQPNGHAVPNFPGWEPLPSWCGRRSRILALPIGIAREEGREVFRC